MIRLLIAFIVATATQAVPKGFQSDVVHDHYSLLHTIEDAWGLDCLNNACNANNLNEFFR